MKRNSILSGIIAGILGPALIFGILWGIFQLLETYGVFGDGTNLTLNFRERTLALVAMAINLLFIQIYKKRRWDEALRGIVIATFILVVAWMVFFGIKLI